MIRTAGGLPRTTARARRGWERTLRGGRAWATSVARRQKQIVLAVVVAFAVVPVPAQAAADVKITMSYFRYCQDDACTPDQFAYVKTRPLPVLPGPTPTPLVDNSRGVVDVRPGDTVVWTYDDPLCDFNDGPGGSPSPVYCPGHNVIFEDGSVVSPLIDARATPRDSFSWTVPETATSGTVIRYYCEPNPGNRHYEIGMTGALRVV